MVLCCCLDPCLGGHLQRVRLNGLSWHVLWIVTLLIQRCFYSSPLSAIQLRYFWWAHKNPSNHSQKLRPLDGFNRGIITHNISPIEPSLQWIPVHVHNTFFLFYWLPLKQVWFWPRSTFHIICWPEFAVLDTLSLFKKLTHYSKGCRACARPSWSWPAWGDLVWKIHNNLLTS